MEIRSGAHFNGTRNSFLGVEHGRQLNAHTIMTNEELAKTKRFLQLFVLVECDETALKVGNCRKRTTDRICKSMRLTYVLWERC